MLRLRRLFLCCAILAAVFGSVSITRATDILSSPGLGSTNTSSHDNTLGYDFTVGTNALSVSALGAYRGAGFNGTEVGLWDSSGVLLAQIDVPSGGTGSFAFANLLTPVLLAPGQTYVLGARYPVGTPLVINSPGQTLFDSANVTVNEDRFVIGSGFAFPASTDGTTQSYVGPNARYTVVAVPEPANIPLLGMGGGALLISSRCFRRSRPRA